MVNIYEEILHVRPIPPTRTHRVGKDIRMFCRACSQLSKTGWYYEGLGRYRDIEEVGGLKRFYHSGICEPCGVESALIDGDVL